MMRLAALLAVAIGLAACAQQPPPPQVWGKLDGNPSTAEEKSRFYRDEAGCKYELAQMAYGAPNRPFYFQSTGNSGFDTGLATLGSSIARAPPAGMYEACMAARGWRRFS
jgi:hypothetical protein